MRAIFRACLTRAPTIGLAVDTECTLFQLDGVSEDCLTLNVFRPSGVSTSAALPVMVWVYGGGFERGSASMFDANQIISQSVTRVSHV